MSTCGHFITILGARALWLRVAVARRVLRSRIAAARRVLLCSRIAAAPSRLVTGVAPPRVEGAGGLACLVSH